MLSCESGKVRIVNDELRALGPRLRGLRLSRGLTLERLSERSGISASTISRLESGKRQASLELLLPLTRELGATLDDLVPAADPDPRVRRSLIRHGGIVFAPLSRPSSATSAYKITYPPGTPLSAPQTHEGRDWLYVLSGRLLLALGGSETTLEAGEAAEFDTRTPHAMTAAGSRPAQVISIFTPDGERMHVHVAPDEPADEERPLDQV